MCSVICILQLIRDYKSCYKRVSRKYIKSEQKFFYLIEILNLNAQTCAFVCVQRYIQSLMEILEFLDKSPEDHSALEE